MQTAWIRMRHRVTWCLTQIQAVWHSDNIFAIFFSPIEALWNLKQIIYLADNLFRGLRVNPSIEMANTVKPVYLNSLPATVDSLCKQFGPSSRATQYGALSEIQTVWYLDYISANNLVETIFERKDNNHHFIYRIFST